MITQLRRIRQVLQGLLPFLLLAVELTPKVLIVEITFEALEKGVVKLDLSAFKTLPVAIRTGAGDGEVYPIGRDAVLLGVVEDGLKGGKDLARVSG